MKNGFTLIEILITIFIMGILMSLTVNYMRDIRQNKTMLGIAEGVSASLEETRTNAQAGLNGERHGIKFENDSYIIFEGSSYDAMDTNNKTMIIDDEYEISTTLTNDVVVFSKIKGEPDNTGKIKISLIEDANKYVEVNIGDLGDIAVLK